MLRRSWVLLALAATACAGPQATRSGATPTTAPSGTSSPGGATPKPAEGAEGPFRELLAREAAGLARRPLAFPDGRATGEIEVAAEPALKREGEAWLISAPIGSAIPVSCILYDKPIDA